MKNVDGLDQPEAREHLCDSTRGWTLGQIRSESRSTRTEHMGVTNVDQLLRTLSAVGVAGLLTLSLAGCGDDKGETRESLEAEQSVIQEEEKTVAEQDLASSEVTPGVLALMVVNATLGDAEPLAEYGGIPSVDSAVAMAQEMYAETLDETLDTSPTEEQMDAYNAAIADAFDRIEVTILEEEVDGDQGRGVVAIRGIDFGEGSRLAKQDPESEALNSTDPDKALHLRLLRSWELSPLFEEPREVENNFVLDPKTGKWKSPSFVEYVQTTGSVYAAFMGQ